MNRTVIARIAPLLIFMFISVSMFGQEPENDLVPEADTSIQRVNGLRIFIDCARCDMNYIREEVPYVNYVRDVKEAQLYIMETSDMTGSGGRRYTYAFVGQQEFAGMNDTLVYSSRPDDSRDYQRIWRTQMLKMGLMPYVAKTPLYSEVLINPTERVEQDVVEDKWNNWVFELEAEPDFEGEESYKELELSSSPKSHMTGSLSWILITAIPGPNIPTTIPYTPIIKVMGDLICWWLRVLANTGRQV